MNRVLTKTKQNKENKPKLVVSKTDALEPPRNKIKQIKTIHTSCFINL